MDNVQEIKNRLNIIDIIGEYTELKKAGRTYKACCPFHKEKTPSFTVSEEKQLFYCFGCGVGGDMFKFIELQERVDFSEALRILADKAGVKLEKNQTGIKKELKDKLREITEESAKFFEQNLQKNQTAQDYFSKRNMQPETVADFRLGYAPDDFHALHTFLEKKGYNSQEILQSGVASTKEVNGEIYDRFRGRVIFPITSAQGQIIAFGGRILDKGEPKYLNSSESPLYKKSSILFGLSQARQAFRDKNIAVVVEGYFDVITSHQAGFKNTVAPCGTALTEDQIREIKRFTKKIIFAFDTDQAGQKATARAIMLAQPLEVELYVAQVPSGKDPDEFIQKNPEKWAEILKKPMPAWEFLKQKALNFYGESATDKRKIVQALSEYLNSTPSPVERETYINDLAQAISIDAEIIKTELKTKKSTYKKTEEAKISKPKHSLEQHLLGFLINYPTWIENVQINLTNDEILKKTCIFLQKHYASQEEGKEKLFLDDTFSQEEKDKIDLAGLIVAEKYQNFPQKEQKSEFKKILNRVYKQFVSHRQEEIKQKIQNARQENNSDEEAKLLQELNQIITTFRPYQK